MRLAVIAFFAALGLTVTLAGASLLGYDAQSIGLLIGSMEGEREPQAPEAPKEERQAAVEEAAYPVPSGTFKGPTGKPTMRGPTGPPPNE